MHHTIRPAGESVEGWTFQVHAASREWLGNLITAFTESRLVIQIPGGSLVRPGLSPMGAAIVPLGGTAPGSRDARSAWRFRVPPHSPDGGMNEVRAKQMAWTAAGVVMGGVAAGLLLSRRSAARREFHPTLRGGPLLVAHRGGLALAPENTLEAFGQAFREWAADMIELDVHASADGECVVIHDPTVDRTTDGSGAVAELTVAQLRALDAGFRFTPDGGRTFPFRGRGIRIPTIREVLEAFPGERLTVELKAAAAQAPLLAAIRDAGAEKRVIVAGERNAFRTLLSGYAGAISASMEQFRRFLVLHRLRLARWWTPPFDVAQVPESWQGERYLTPSMVAELRAHGVPLHVWVVNEFEDMERLLDWGVDGLVTDRPDRLAELLTHRYGRAPAPAHARQVHVE
jgi:glycerophosphoryl diester phosphodiesterase